MQANVLVLYPAQDTDAHISPYVANISLYVGAKVLSQ